MFLRGAFFLGCSTQRHKLSAALSVCRQVASAGRVAICIRQGHRERVFSANMYADGELHDDAEHCTVPVREPGQQQCEGAGGQLVLETSREEYLWSTTPSTPNLSFGIGDLLPTCGRHLTRVPHVHRLRRFVWAQCVGRSHYRSGCVSWLLLADAAAGLNQGSHQAMQACAEQMNQQHARGELVYNHTGINCAYVVGAILRAGGIEISVTEKTGAPWANIPIQIAMGCVEWAQQAGSTNIHSCLYNKYAHSTFKNQEGGAAQSARRIVNSLVSGVQFKDLANRLPTFR